MESKNFRYYAFISYAHEDEKWADWLQKEVENYKLPTTIHKDYANALPQKVQPLFRDIPDLAAGGRLDNVLKEELEDSNYLIIVCSPSSAKSEWVNKEVQHFIDIGREDRIIPFIVSGKPNCGEEDSALECYPPAIRGRHILGAAVDGIADTAKLSGKQKKAARKQNRIIKDTAKLKVIAGLLSVKLDVLVRRHEQKIKQKRRSRAVAAILCAAVILSGALFAVDYYVPKVKYYKDYIEIYGAATGIEEINAAERGSQQYSYRITEVKNHVISVERVDGSDQLLADELLGYTYDEIDMRPAKIAYEYAGSTLKSALYYSSTDKPIVEYSYFDESTIYLKRISPESDAEFGEKYQMKWSCDMVKDMSLSEYEDAVLSYVTGFEVQYDVKGRVVTRHYINSNMARDNIVNDIRHVAGEKYTYDANGRIASISFIDKEGESTFIFENGISSIEFDYSDDTTEIEYLDIMGGPVKNEYYKIKIDESKKREKTITFYNYDGETAGT
ncbi:MAG: toll/interleukin-1 receptor domain-containing protein [Clostridia bacterium]|nr:toll/interleukin-1 receptor domain-containing protein [Clostridia bacterium]